MSDLGSSLTGSVTGSVESAKARVETAKSGKQMLDQGGPTKEAEVYALNAMRSARDTDDKLTKMLNDDVKMYEEAVRSIKKALASPPNTISMMPERITEFKTLLKQYEARLKSAKEAARAMSSVKPALPKISPAEDDACKLLWVKLIGRPTDKPPIMRPEPKR